MSKPPGWPVGPTAPLYTDVLTEDVGSGDAYVYTGICECGWEGPSHCVRLKGQRPATAEDYEVVHTKAVEDVEAHVAQRHPHRR